MVGGHGVFPPWNNIWSLYSNVIYVCLSFILCFLDQMWIAIFYFYSSYIHDTLLFSQVEELPPIISQCESAMWALDPGFCSSK